MVTRVSTSLLIAVFLSIVFVFCTLDLVKSEIQTLPQYRVKRQFDNNGFNNFGGGFDDNNFPSGRRRGSNRRSQNQNQGRRGPIFFPNNDNDFDSQNQFQQQPINGGNNQLIFSTNPQRQQQTIPNGSNNGLAFATTSTPAPGQQVFINNRPVLATMAPFTGRTTATPQFLSCFNSCPTTSEYNPICGSDQELYHNEQKYNCAVRCGANIQIVRRGSCQGLFPMMRG